MARALNDNQPFAARLPIVIGGERRVYDVHALNISNGSAGTPPNGALIIVTDRKTSGRVSAHQPASGDP